jgi:hypothetical protein
LNPSWRSAGTKRAFNALFISSRLIEVSHVAEAAKLPPVFTAIVSDSGGDVDCLKVAEPGPTTLGSDRPEPPFGPHLRNAQS